LLNIDGSIDQLKGDSTRTDPGCYPHREIDDTDSVPNTSLSDNLPKLV